ncbi:MAG: UDP-GlcNAc--UDP-phosphate GlcNAc-1-phosphate transferase [Bacteroidetes bacterium HGW-Bacteroidetes-10]|nr:MAG: UDP-GlcNAc--UDP-phosphate GlcNAc-1-phosphate transferase [Bacteroidetes bacterium HGW-Bacteroidetes-10]
MILLIFGLLIFSILAYFKIADNYNIIDKPNDRSSHKYITLRGGGIIFYIGALLYFLFYGFSYPLFALGLTLIAIISFLDDIKTVNSKVRILVHFSAMLLMFYDCGLYSLPWYFNLTALIVSTGIINAYNFMDGINGITGGYSLVAMGSFWWINNYIHPFIDNNFLYVIGISLLGFNFFNFRRRARCFAGDVGAVSIAFIIVFLLGKLIAETDNPSFIIILMLYGVDSILTIIHRLILNENIFLAHRKHLYQIMSNELKIPHTTVSLTYMAVQALIMVGYFAYLKLNPSTSPWFYFLAIASLLTGIYVWLMKRYFKLHQG